MAYWGYMEFIRNYLQRVERPNVMEIGLDKGQTFIPLLAHLMKNFETFTLFGVDVLVKEAFRVQYEIMSQELSSPTENDPNSGQILKVFENSSLAVLEQLSSFPENHQVIHVLLIDGDHNYYTVKRELEYAKFLLHPQGVIIIDDYSNRWGDKDEYFAELPGYENNKYVSKREDIEHPEKKGLKPAVDDFLEQNKDWVLTDAVFPGAEPRLLYRHDSGLELQSIATGETIALPPGTHDMPVEKEKRR